MRAEIVKWFPDRGYGFAKPSHGEHDLIVHADAIISGQPYQGAAIECNETIVGRRRRATDVRILRD